MANTLNLGTDGNWATKENSLLGYNSENGNYKPLPFDFTRASSATVVNKAGLIETVGNNIPRIDFKDNTNGALLLEPQKTNLVTYSEDFSSSWASSGTNPPVLTPSQFISPDGTQNASRLQIPITNTTSILQQLFSHTSGEEYTVSAYVKSNSSSNQEFKLYGDYGVPTGISGVLIATSEWQRFTFTYTATGTGSRSGGFYYVPNTNTDIQIYGFQAEKGSYATSYIPTSGSAVTRLLDSCSNGGNEQVINSTEGVLYFNAMTKDSSSTSKAISISNGSNTILSSYFYGASINVVFNINGVNQFYANFSITIGQEYKIAILYQENNFALYVDGVKRVEETNGSVPSINTFNTLNFAQESSSNFYGNVKDVRVYNTALTDEELQALTTI